ncbi:hypothetical protein GCM10022198_15460 [Klugiella xanthotipulae]|uniref:MmyB family transcriptional regulator n=1 Tax=Klugiella xanthotipulae TaxID=244735 RepID=UPI00319D9C48
MSRRPDRRNPVKHPARVQLPHQDVSTQSETFRARWASHNVRFHRSGRKALRHPAVGDLGLTIEAMGLPADPGLTLFVYTAEPAEGIRTARSE